MKQLTNGALHHNRKAFAFSKTNERHVLLIGLIFILGVLGTGCQKDSLGSKELAVNSNDRSAQKESNGFGNYTGLASETVWELQQAKIATAKYNNFDQAIADGYFDINVIVPEMGYHYLKMDNLNGTFDYAKPEILVYNKEENGRMKLVALEYAVPISSSPNAPPSGFTGTNDVWSVYQGILWTLHAWVWEYNPAGVFNPTNPLVHLH